MEFRTHLSTFRLTFPPRKFYPCYAVSVFFVRILHNTSIFTVDNCNKHIIPIHILNKSEHAVHSIPTLPIKSEFAVEECCVMINNAW